MINVVAHALRKVRDIMIEADIMKHKGNMQINYTYQYHQENSIGTLSIRQARDLNNETLKDELIAQIQTLVRELFGNHSFNYVAKITLGKGLFRITITLDDGYTFTAKIREKRLIVDKD